MSIFRKYNDSNFESILKAFQYNLITWDNAQRQMGLKPSKKDDRYGKYFKEIPKMFDIGIPEGYEQTDPSGVGIKKTEAE